MHTPVHHRPRVAEGTVEGYRIIKAGAAAMSCVKAAAPTDKLLGTSDELDHVIGEVVDMAVIPVARVRLGGNVAAGDALTSDANAKAVATTTIGHRIIGFAEIAGAADDVITYVYAPGVL